MLLDLGDALGHVLSFLNAVDLWRAEATCLELCALVRPLWKALASRAMQGSQLLGELSPGLWKALCAEVAGSCQRAPRSQLTAVVCASSRDREEEKASNLLFASVCDVRPQVECQCHPHGPFMGSRPCYWSSGATNSDDAVEHIDFALTGYACLLHRVSLRAYSPEFHPHAPVYAPKAACVSFGAFQNRVPGSSTDLVGPRLHDSGKAPLRHSRDEQVVAHFDPPLLVLGGHMRLSLHGAQQQCTLPLFGNSYYVCLSHVAALGSRVEWLRPAAVQPLTPADADTTAAASLLQDLVVGCCDVTKQSSKGSRLWVSDTPPFAREHADARNSCQCGMRSCRQCSTGRRAATAKASE